LAILCTHPFTAQTQWPWDGGNEAIDFGNACHEVSELYAKREPVNLVEIGSKHKLSAPNQKRFEAVSNTIVDEIDRMIADGWTLKPELAIAYHVESATARRLVRKHHRDYSDRKAGELTATIDLVMTRGNEVAIADWKTGRRIEHEGKTTWQMLFGGLAVARLLGVQEIRATLLYVDEEGCFADGADLDYFDLEAADADIRGLWARLNAGPSAPTPGPHCTRDYCPLLGRCAATRSALAEVVSDSPLLAKLHEPGAAKRALQMLSSAQAALDAIKSELQEIAKHQPIDMGDGTVYVQVENERETTRMDHDLFAQLEEWIGPERAAECVELKTSKAAIERAMGGKKAARPVLEQLRERGAIKTSKYTRFDFIKKTGSDSQ
jgi:hypothetical protein